MQSEDEKSALLGGGAEDSTKAPVTIDPAAKGARPKIRNPKEAKRRRFVMKQAKTIAKPQPLESVSETEEGATLLSRPGEGVRTEFFGVRSYVHTFYEAMAMDHPTHEEGRRFFLESSSAPLRKRRKRALCWRAVLCSGLLFLAAGLTAILVGFLVPRRREVVQVQEDIEIVDRAEQAFNRDLDVCRVVGVVLFCAGGLAVAAVLLAMTRRHSRVGEEEEEEGLAMAERQEEEEEGTPVDAKVPATEELTTVQPKRSDPEEVVMTKAGLCKVP